MNTRPSAQTPGFFDVELRVQWLEAKGNPLSRLDAVIDREAKIKTRNDQKPINHERSNVRKTQTKGTAMNPSTPKTELPSSTQLRKVVFGGAHVPLSRTDPFPQPRS